VFLEVAKDNMGGTAANKQNTDAPSFEKVVRQAHHKVIDVAQCCCSQFGFRQPPREK